MKIRTDFVTNSSSSSFTVVQLKSPSLKKWMKENKISMKRLEEELADTIDGGGDGFGETNCEQLEDCKGVAEMMLCLLEKGKLSEYIEENKEAINQNSSASVYCVSQFESDPLEISFLNIDKHGANLERYDWGGLSEENVEEIEEECGEIPTELCDWSSKLVKTVVEKIRAANEE